MRAARTGRIGVAVSSNERSLDARSSTAHTSTSDGRPSGCFDSIASTSSSTSIGTVASSDGRGGGSIRCMANISAALSATNAERPVSISNTMPPSE